jgi:hypothetical protein
MRDEHELKEAYISRRKVGQSYENFLCVVVKEPAPRPARGGGTVAVVPIWRRANDGRVEVALVHDGAQTKVWSLPKQARRLTKPKADGSTIIVSDPIDVMFHAESIRELESLECNAAVPQVVGWVDRNASICPQWLLDERAKIKKVGVEKWSKPPRLVSLVKGKWRQNRFSGDEEVFEKLMGHVKHMIHLYEWWTCEQRRAIGWRNSFYQKMAHDLLTGGKYGKVVLADMDLARKVKKGKVRGKESTPDPIQALRFKVAPYMLGQSLKGAASNFGVAFVNSKVKPEGGSGALERMVVRLYLGAHEEAAAA